MLLLGFYFLNPGEVGYSYLNLPFSASEALLGPAEGLGVQEPGRLGVSLASFVAGVKLGAVEYRGFKGFDLSVKYLNSGGIEEYTIVGEPTGRILYAHLMAFELTKPLGDFSVSAELLPQFLGDEKAFALALGARWTRAFEGFRLGAGLEHLGFELVAAGGRKADLPLTLELAGGWRSPGEAFEGWLFLASQRDYPLYAGGSLAWRVYSYPLELLLGYNSKGRELSAGSGGDPLNGLSAGFRLKLSDKRLLYSWTPFGELGDVHRLELRFGCPGR